MDRNIYRTPASDLGEQPDSSLLRKKKRVFIVILCYLLSSIGLLTLAGWIISAIFDFDGSLFTILPFIIIAPMWMHIKMSRAWIEDIRLGKKSQSSALRYQSLPFVFSQPKIFCHPGTAMALL
ncbi:hypothetical protein ACNKU7_08185 [Microbulbifer sp. SA54]|uniref:hypothetical protein n=1 Tax=Microbulbifer sp. SA54 TaxID=3401577 RepID=UPI003AB0B343